MMRAVTAAFGRAVVTQLHIRMLLLSIAPFLLSLLIWGLILYFSFQPMLDWVHGYFLANDLFRSAGGWLSTWGGTIAASVIVPLVAMWVFLPLMILTALVFIGVMAMPVIIGHIAGRHYPLLERRRGGSFAGSLWRSLSSFAIFVLLWIVSLPLSVIPPLGFVITPLLWGWLTYRVLSYDALAEHADKEEFQAILRLHRTPLLVIGTLTGILGAAPTLLWLGGALFIIFLPVFAVLSIWLYVLVFIFTGIWFEHYCLNALAAYRAGIVPAERQIKDIN